MPLARFVFWAATLGGIVLAIRAVVIDPPPLWIAVACSGAYAAIVLAGVLDLRLRMFADAILRGPSDARGVVLTFDDGPDPEHTRAVLDALDAAKAKATFFVIGAKAEKHPEVVKEIVERGHAVGVHGFEHDRLFSLRGPRRVERDLQRAVKALEKITGEKPTLFRPPVGHTNPTIARIADRLELTMIGWSVRARDGLAGTSADDVVKRIKRGLADGAIVLLHDAAERGDRKPAGVVALPRVLDAIAEQNLTVVPLGDWLRDAG
jgi:peptidoglycan/xylan/chitin deacetylase (PgdA/CDA1 family)